MKLFTQAQIDFIMLRKIEIGKAYDFPEFEFSGYLRPTITSGTVMQDIFLPDRLRTECFQVKEKVGPFYLGNFEQYPIPDDFYLLEDDLAARPFEVVILLLLVCTIPFAVYNALNWGYEKLIS